MSSTAKVEAETAMAKMSLNENVEVEKAESIATPRTNVDPGKPETVATPSANTEREKPHKIVLPPEIIRKIVTEYLTAAYNEHINARISTTPAFLDGLQRDLTLRLNNDFRNRGDTPSYNLRSSDAMQAMRQYMVPIQARIGPLTPTSFPAEILRVPFMPMDQHLPFYSRPHDQNFSLTVAPLASASPLLAAVAAKVCKKLIKVAHKKTLRLWTQNGNLQSVDLTIPEFLEAVRVRDHVSVTERASNVLVGVVAMLERREVEQALMMHSVDAVESEQDDVNFDVTVEAFAGYL